VTIFQLEACFDFRNICKSLHITLQSSFGNVPFELKKSTISLSLHQLEARSRSSRDCIQFLPHWRRFFSLKVRVPILKLAKILDSIRSSLSSLIALEIWGVFFSALLLTRQHTFSAY